MVINPFFFVCVFILVFNLENTLKYAIHFLGVSTVLLYALFYFNEMKWNEWILPNPSNKCYIFHFWYVCENVCVCMYVYLIVFLKISNFFCVVQLLCFFAGIAAWPKGLGDELRHICIGCPGKRCMVSKKSDIEMFNSPWLRAPSPAIWAMPLCHLWVSK